jgi:ABC-2 type transport system ATP-binding protein
MNHAVKIENFSKSYVDVHAVKNISLCVKPGEIYGFLGLNGAGKTTTIRAMLGMIRPSAGNINILGEPVGPAGQGPWGKVGYLVENASAYPDLTVRENLEIARRLHGLHNPAVVNDVIDRLALRPYANRKAGKLSTGNLQRLCLARAILHQPELLILDEPGNGLDPAGVVEIRELLADMANNHHVTIFMSSHILTEVERLATRVGIIHNGQLIEDLGKDKLTQFRMQQLEVETRNAALALQTLQAAGYVVSPNGHDSIYLTDQRAIDRPEDIAVLLVNANVPPVKLGLKQQTLEEHFMHLTGAKQ